MIDWKTYNKEWEREPDKLEWTYKGYKCLVWRGRLKHLCGYVGLPKKHYFYGKDYSSNYGRGIYVHGGLTYSQMDKDELWWIGFDAAHWQDLVPESIENLYKHGLEINYRLEHETYKNIDYMIQEVENLVDQIEGITYGKIRYDKKCKYWRKRRNEKGS